ncbi:DUF3500 domain-containing protein [Pseudonocardia acaciae]|uniref:DUF3500 domain-containing protein n=1 Tax=Pseudonocardia acaciae TaxID=551276 RepID=UPI001FE228C9|nr:DUF3500 domain-containing protein [Pseudonocardia acaciae]
MSAGTDASLPRSAETGSGSGSGSGAAAVADRMADAATALLAGLDDDQRSRAAWAWPSGAEPDSETERRRWFYTPTDHGGLPVGAMSPGQYRRAMALVATGLSEAGYVTAASIMGLENVLDRVEGFAGASFGRERGRDPGMYYLRVFGTPGDPMWGWRFGGHHVSLNNLVVSGSLVSCTPCFLGADPASAPLLGSRELRLLGGVEDLARELVLSLEPSLRAEAVLTPRAPADIASANRPKVGPGDRVLPLGSLFRDRFTDPAMANRMDAVQRDIERRYRVTEADHDAVELTASPKGVPASALDSGQRDLLRALLDCYLGRAPAEMAARYAERYAGALLDGVHVAWAGSFEPGQACYYRLQGPRLLVEYDNAQRMANHAHSVWRDPEGDFGADVLAAHHAAHHTGP